MNIEQLSDGLLELVFRNLDLKSRTACELTCQRWRKVLQWIPLPPIYLWVGHDRSNFYEYPRPPVVFGESLFRNWDICKMDVNSARFFLRKHRRAKELLLRVESEDVLSEFLDLIEREWLCLDSLKIYADFSLDETVPKLTKLRIAKYVTWIKALTINANSTLMEYLCESCSNLQGIYLDDITPKQMRHLTKFKELKSLFLPYFAIETDEEREWLIAKMGHLEEFSVHTLRPDDLRRVCATMTKLVTFAFKLQYEMSTGIRPLVDLENLRNLWMYCSSPGIETELSQVLAHCTNLKTLTLQNEAIKPAVLNSLPYCVPQLEILDLVNRRDLRPLPAFDCLPQLASMLHLRTLCITAMPDFGRPLCNFIKNSSSIRSVDAKDIEEEDVGARVLEAMCRKAAAHKSEQFRLRVDILSESVANLPKNLKLFYLRSSPGTA